MRNASFSDGSPARAHVSMALRMLSEWPMACVLRSGDISGDGIATGDGFSLFWGVGTRSTHSPRCGRSDRSLPSSSSSKSRGPVGMTKRFLSCASQCSNRPVARSQT
eukprot:CAMPEP_0195088108 /NCGR_PEP_ID=MMETSP0448-20130528/27757_1 /TAXON_ID=66468 /ORGANISM="Heterocapsa triquestra, Strain CCMP 448" /LENGTH=106 /DNA_ID=CAMNT_0040121725 /DNA_START=6 /DNA_END=322 /DNA_ORIENTATION=-